MILVCKSNGKMDTEPPNQMRETMPVWKAQNPGSIDETMKPIDRTVDDHSSAPLSTHPAAASTLPIRIPVRRV
jgi:hypothetical protein